MQACWLQHMSLDEVTGLDPGAAKIRAIQGLAAVEFFAGYHNIHFQLKIISQNCYFTFCYLVLHDEFDQHQFECFPSVNQLCLMPWHRESASGTLKPENYKPYCFRYYHVWAKLTESLVQMGYDSNNLVRISKLS